MNIYTLYNDTHSELFNNFFKATYENINQENNYNLIAIDKKDCSLNCSFRNDKWRELMLAKVELIIQAIDENTEPFLYADADVIFLKDFKGDLLPIINDHDILAQKDPGGFCAGLFVCVPHNKTKRFFEEVRKRTLETSDQVQFNKLSHMVNISFLPRIQYSNPWLLRPRGQSNFVDDKVNFTIDKSIKIFHANNERLLHNKIKMLTYVQKASDDIL